MSNVRDWAYILNETVIDCCRSNAENVAIYPFPFDEAIDITDISPRPGPGWTWKNGAFVRPASQRPTPPPADPVMAKLTAIEARLDALERKP